MLLNGENYTSFFLIQLKDVFIIMQLNNDKSQTYYFRLCDDGKYRINCSLCSQIAATIDVNSSNYIGSLEKELNSDYTDTLVKWLNSLDISEVDFQTKHNEIMQFGIDNYCEECGKVYCKKHWETRAIFEDSGWYHHTNNVCPKGHTKMIDD
jgi:hypothetical protein